MRFRIADAHFEMADMRHAKTQQPHAAENEMRAWAVAGEWLSLLSAGYLPLTLVWMAPYDRVSLV
jgi:hypothetical protein